MADWLKTLIDKAKVSTVLMGLERTQIILDANEQLRRRFTRRIYLKPFDLECSTSRSHFLGVIKKIDEALGLPSPLDLQQDGIVRQLHFATNGTMDYMVKLMVLIKLRHIVNYRGLTVNVWRRHSVTQSGLKAWAS